MYFSGVLGENHQPFAGHRKTQVFKIVKFMTALHRIKYDLNIFQKHLYIDKILYITTVAHCEVYSIQHYVIKFVSDFRQVGGLLLFPPPIKLPATI